MDNFGRTPLDHNFKSQKDYFRILTIYSNMYHSPDKRPLQGSIKHYEDMIHKDLEERGLVYKNTDIFTKMARRVFSHEFRAVFSKNLQK